MGVEGSYLQGQVTLDYLTLFDLEYEDYDPPKYR
jgi:hypothetical protein